MSHVQHCAVERQSFMLHNTRLEFDESRRTILVGHRTVTTNSKTSIAQRLAII